MRLEIVDESEILPHLTFLLEWMDFKQDFFALNHAHSIQDFLYHQSQITHNALCDTFVNDLIHTLDSNLSHNALSQISLHNLLSITPTIKNQFYHEINVYLNLLTQIVMQGYASSSLTALTLFLEVIFIDSQEMQILNQTYMNKAYATDVLSFPLEVFEIKEEQCLGSIIINVNLMQTKSQEYRHNLYAEMSLLFIHALLHILGFDHENDKGEHRKAEAHILQTLHLPISLIARNT